MAKDDAAPEGGDELITAPEEVLELDQPVVEETTSPTVEDVASELGWVPKEKFKGKEEDWKPAVDFIREGKNIQKGLAKDLKRLTSQVDNMSRTSAAILQERLEQQRQELTAAHNQAVEDGDSAAALNISKKLGQLDRQAPPSVSSESQEWVQRNPWFNSHPIARQVALATAQAYADQGKGTSEQLQAAEDEVRRAYPQLFGAQAKPAPGVSQPGSRSASQPARAKGFSDMPREAQNIAKDMVDRGVIKSVDDYTRNYWITEGKAK